MKSSWKLAGSLTAVVLIALALVYSAPTVGAASGGTIKGTIKLDGTAPHQRPIDMSKDPACSQQHTGSPVKTETVVVGPNNGIRYAVVYLSEGLPANAAAEVPSKPVVYDQKGCEYQPHVAAMDVGQPLKVTNSDPTTHNIHPMPQPGSGNNGWNKSQPAGAPPIDTKWNAEEVAIPVKCNIHPWMHGYMVVVKGPYAVSGADGTYTIENVPPGNYTVTAWQETYGKQTQKVTVAAGKPATADFTYKAK